MVMGPAGPMCCAPEPWGSPSRGTTPPSLPNRAKKNPRTGWGRVGRPQAAWNTVDCILRSARGQSIQNGNRLSHGRGGRGLSASKAKGFRPPRHLFATAMAGGFGEGWLLTYNPPSADLTVGRFRRLRTPYFVFAPACRSGRASRENEAPLNPARMIKFVHSLDKNSDVSRRARQAAPFENSACTRR